METTLFLLEDISEDAVYSLFVCHSLCARGCGLLRVSQAALGTSERVPQVLHPPPGCACLGLCMEPHLGSQDVVELVGMFAAWHRGMLG